MPDGDVVGMTAFAHQALVYGSDGEFLDGASAFLKDGEQAVVVTTPHNIGLLAQAGFTQRVQYVDPAAWYTAPGAALGACYELVEQHRGPGPLCLIGESPWSGRTPLQVTEWHRYESVLNITFDGTRSRILCPYDTRVVPADVVARAAATHPEIITGGAGAAPSPGYRDPAEFSAECDRDPMQAPAGDVSEYPIVRDCLHKLRQFASVEAIGRGLAGDRLADFLTALNEVSSNVLVHGGGRGRVVLWTDDEDIVCDVIDQAGRLTDPLAGYRRPSPDATRGLGLWMTRQLCDLVQIRTSAAGTVVRLRTRLDTAQRLTRRHRARS